MYKKNPIRYLAVVTRVLVLLTIMAAISPQCRADPILIRVVGEYSDTSSSNVNMALFGNHLTTTALWTYLIEDLPFDLINQPGATDHTNKSVTVEINQTAFLYNESFSNVYPPSTGDYNLGVYICYSHSPNAQPACTIATSNQHITGSSKVHLLSTSPISSQSGAYGTASSTNLFSASDPITNVNFCFVLTSVDGVNAGTTYNLISKPVTCSDANSSFPATASGCSINANNNLAVEFGELDRSKIATTITSGGQGSISKSIPVTCTGDAAINVKTQFQFTPISVNNHQVISTSTSNLGVALLYKGSVISPTDSIEEQYNVGTTDINLEFEAVRDPTVATKEIATGDFTASAVMVMTQQ